MLDFYEGTSWAFVINPCSRSYSLVMYLEDAFGGIRDDQFLSIMRRFVSASKSPATCTRSSQPRLYIRPAPHKNRFRFSSAPPKYSPTSLSIYKRLRQFHSSTQTMSATAPAFYNLQADLPGDKTYDFEQLKGKVVLIVNVASQWYV